MKLMDYIKTQKETPNYMLNQKRMDKELTSSSLNISGKMQMMTPTRTLSSIKRRKVANSALKSSYGRDGDTRVGSPVGKYDPGRTFAKRSFSQMNHLKR